MEYYFFVTGGGSYMSHSDNFNRAPLVNEFVRLDVHNGLQEPVLYRIIAVIHEIGHMRFEIAAMKSF